MKGDEVILLLEEIVIPLIAYLLYTIIVGLKKDIRAYRNGDGTMASVVVGWIITVLESLCLLWNLFLWLIYLL